MYQKFRANTQSSWAVVIASRWARPSAIVHLSTHHKRIILCSKYNIQLQCKKKATKSATPEHNHHHHHLFEVLKEQVVTSKLEIAQMSDNQHANHDALLGAGYVLLYVYIISCLADGFLWFRSSMVRHNALEHTTATHLASKQQACMGLAGAVII